MSYRLTILGIIALLALLGCRGGGLQPDAAAQPRLVNFTDGGPVAGVSLASIADGLSLSFDEFPAAGQLIHLELSANQTIVSSAWSSADNLLELVAPARGGADIGVVPLAGYAGSGLTLHLRLGATARQVSVAGPPVGPENALFDLALEQGGAGQVRLSWTEVNRGDYDFNGEVNLGDLSVLGKYFSSPIDRSAPDANQHQGFWVDGDSNGLITLADLTVIGSHYQNSVSGYTVLRNGVPVPGTDSPTLTAPRPADASAAKLPPRYTLVLDGSPVDTWSVAPVDVNGVAGTGGTVPPIPVDLSIKLASAGLSLFNLDGSGVGNDAQGRSQIRIVDSGDLMRIIDPIDTVDSAEIGSGLGSTTGNAGFTGLPRGQWLLAQVLLAPTVDPATGAPLTWNAAAPHYIALHAPVFLPTGTSVSQLSLSTTFTRGAGGKYSVRIASQFQSNKLSKYVAQLDFAGQRVATDTNNDGSFNDELWLPDPRECGLSTARLTQLVEYNDNAGGTNGAASVTGQFGALDLPTAQFTVTSGQLTLPSGTTAHSPLTGGVTEQTTFNQLHITTTGQVTSEIAPGDLLPGDDLRLTGYLLDGVAGQPPSLWITGVTRVVDLTKPDKLYAWPDKTSVFPGEPVTINVVSEQAAHEFFGLQHVRITFDAGNAAYVQDSFNVGTPGGNRGDMDGIWTAMNATPSSVQLPLESSFVPITLPDGRQALDFYIQPGDGTPLTNATGELFNFQLSITGPVTIGIQRLDSVDPNISETYYSDSTGAPHFWADDYNAGVPGITVKSPGPGGP